MKKPRVRTFMGGTGRSGTTLLGNVVGMHPDVSFYYEPKFLVLDGGAMQYLEGKIDKTEFRMNIVGERFLKNIVTSGENRLGKDDVRKILDANFVGETKEEEVSNFASALFKAMMKPGSTCWVEKMPHSVRHVDKFAELFPEMRYIHVIREPKDVCASTIQQPWGPNDVESFIKYYIAIMEDAARGFDFAKKNRVPYLVVSMEKLSYEAGKEIRRVMKFLSLKGMPDGAVGSVDEKKGNITRFRSNLTGQESLAVDRKCLAVYSRWLDLAYAPS